MMIAYMPMSINSCGAELPHGLCVFLNRQAPSVFVSPDSNGADSIIPLSPPFTTSGNKKPHFREAFCCVLLSLRDRRLVHHPSIRSHRSSDDRDVHRGMLGRIDCRRQWRTHLQRQLFVRSRCGAVHRKRE